MEKKLEIKWLYVRFPGKIKDELQVKALHEDIVSVKMPRCKGRFCWIECESEEVALRVRKELNGKKLEKGKLRVQMKRPIENIRRKKNNFE